MKFSCSLKQLDDGNWNVRHSGKDVGTVELVAESREAAIEKMRGELRYRLEICPCTGELYRDVEIEVVNS